MPEAEAAIAVNGTYFDGETAGRRPVAAAIEGAALVVRGAEGATIAEWPLADLRRVPGSTRSARELRLSPGHQREERLALSSPVLIADLRRACPAIDQAPPGGRRLARKLLLWSCAALAAIFAMVFVIIPALSDQLAPLIPPEREQAFGRRIADRILTNGIPLLGVSGGECTGEAGLAALRKMTDRLEPLAGAHLPLNVRVLDDEMVNAFAMPGGEIILVRGLLQGAASAEEVAGVLAHEIGHVTAYDPTRNMLRSVATGAVVSIFVGDAFGGALLVILAHEAINASYSRAAEAAADETALSLLTKAGLPAEPLAGFFARLREERGEDGGYLASHPSSASREAFFRKAPPPEAPSPVLNDREWAALQQICDG